MKRTTATMSGLVLMAGVFGMAFAGSVEPPGPPSSGSGLCTLKQIYDYLASGTAVTIPVTFQEPSAGPGPTMYTTKQIYEVVATPVAQCNVTVADVRPGKKFFCTQAGNWGVKTGSMSGGDGVGLLKTGQTSVYRTGDDGTYQKGVDCNYSWDVGAATVKDNATGLIWASDGAGEGCYWRGTLFWSAAVGWAENLSFAGYSDWRLPNRRELMSLVCMFNLEGYPRINGTFFPNTPYYYYWTSTTCARYPDDAWLVAFMDGSSGDIPKDNTIGRCVRAVRGGQ